MENVAKQVELLLSRTGTQEKKSELLNSICNFFQKEPENKQVIFKRGAFYFYKGGLVESSEITGEPDNNASIFIFDGVKVTKVNPVMYTGSISVGTGWGNSEFNSNNNNNNNNNNGNNNG